MRSTFGHAITLAFLLWKGIASPIGSTCTTYNDCDGQLICTQGVCSELPTTETCSWAGHGFGASCTSDNLCSDDDVCDPTGSICVDPYAVDEYPPFQVTFSCWDHQYSTTGPDCGHAHNVTCPTGGIATESLLEIQGTYFNTGNVDIQILVDSTTYSTSATAVAGHPGQLGGWFDLKTYAPCPDLAYPSYVQFTDSCTGKVLGFNYPT